MAASKTVFLINGAWMNADCWANFRKPFDAAGYAVHTSDWPYLDKGTAAELRANPPRPLGALGVTDIVDHFAGLIRGLPESPLIVGHSFGGLFTQLLLDRGVGAAGIAIDPAPIGGVIPGPLSLAAAFPVLARPDGWNQPHTLTREAFAANFANTIDAAAQADAYDRLVVPTSGRIFYQAASWIGTYIHPKRRTVPLLMTVGAKDRTVTPYVARAAFHHQKQSAAPTEFKRFEGRSHYLIAEPGWEEVAGFCADWAAKL